MRQLTEAERLSDRIGVKEHQAVHLAEQIIEDTMVLALLSDGTAPEGTGFASEAECAEFVESAKVKLTDDLGELGVLYGQLGELIAAEQVAA